MEESDPNVLFPLMNFVLWELKRNDIDSDCHENNWHIMKKHNSWRHQAMTIGPYLKLIFQIFHTKQFTKGLVEKNNKKKLLIFVKIDKNLNSHILWRKTFYSPNHWVIMTNTQQKFVLCIISPQLLKFWNHLTSFF